MKYKFDDEYFRQVIADNKSASSALRKLGMRAAGGNFKTLYAKIESLGIINDHWQGKENFVPTMGQTSSKMLPLNSILTTKSTYARGHLKRRLIRDEILIEECAICKIPPLWNNQKLVLQLDHINGIYNDNRLENLRLICPNCHSQTETFAGKSTKKNPKYCECSKKINQRSSNCINCSNRKIASSRKSNGSPASDRTRNC